MQTIGQHGCAEAIATLIGTVHRRYLAGWSMPLPPPCRCSPPPVTQGVWGARAAAPGARRSAAARGATAAAGAGAAMPMSTAATPALGLEYMRTGYAELLKWCAGKLALVP